MQQAMSKRNLAILFFSTVAVSLVILIILFSLLFKNVDVSFDTKMPDSAPDLSGFYKDGAPAQTKGDAVSGSTIRVPQDEASRPAATTTPEENSSGLGDEDLNAPAAVETEDIAPKTDTTVAPVPVGSTPIKPEATKPKPPATQTEQPKPAVAPVPKPMRIDPEAGQAPANSTTAPKKETTQSAYQVYIDGFHSKEDAEAKSAQLKSTGQTALVKPAGSGYVVQIGVFGTQQNAQSAAGQSGGKIRKVN